MLASLNKRQQNEEAFSRNIHGALVSPMFPSFPYGKYCFQWHFLFWRCKLCLHYPAGNFNENPSMRELAKILRAWASEHSSNFCVQFEQRPNFASALKLDGTIRYPFGCESNIFCLHDFFSFAAATSLVSEASRLSEKVPTNQNFTIFER